MRASFLVLGPLLARFGCGARLGARAAARLACGPVDQHIKGLEALGAKTRLDHGYVEMTSAGLCGARLAFDLTHGQRHPERDDGSDPRAVARRVIENAAREPEVVELADVLQPHGCRGESAPEATASWCAAVESLHGDPATTSRAIASRRERCWPRAVITRRRRARARVWIPSLLEATLEKLREVGAEIEVRRRQRARA